MSARKVRHREAPSPDGCRWCGVAQRSHGQRWAASKEWHSYTSPTVAQRLARMKARRARRTAGGE